MTIPSDFKASLDRISALFAQTERELASLTIKADFTWQWSSLAMRALSFHRLKGRFRIFYGDKPINDLSAADKVEVAEHLYEFKDAYTKHLNQLAERARKAGL